LADTDEQESAMGTGQIVPSAPVERTAPRRWKRRLLLAFASYTLVSLLAIFAAFLLGWASYARSLPDPSGWHFDGPASEFAASDADADYTFDDYLAQEAKVFAELDASIDGEWKAAAQQRLNRFNRASVSFPGVGFDRDWNRTVVLEAEAPKGGALMVHGLSDSPYSIRAAAEAMRAKGWTVIALRVPGHGTSPGALAEASWRDWAAAFRVAAKGLRERIPDGAPLVFFGFSNGGALCVDYSVDALEDPSLPRADAVVLYSPMIGIAPIARVSKLYRLISWFPPFEKVRWMHIEDEIDPYKYSSWPMRASEQAFLLTSRIAARLASAARSGRAAELPPMLAFQSIVDSTVRVPDLMRTLFDRLPPGVSELIFFDLNDDAVFQDLLRDGNAPLVQQRMENAALPYRLTLVTGDDAGVIARTRDGDAVTERPLGLNWPAEVFSLSHVAVPIRPDDPVLGTREASEGFPAIALGAIRVRGEHGVLRVSEGLVMRMRHNPFYAFVEAETDAWLKKVVGQE
jgi:alpha-beta hydrolase superfamily lysophospholipase